MGVDELPPGLGVRQLLPQSAYVYIHGAVARSERAAPCLLSQFLPSDHSARAAGECDQKAQLMASQVQRPAADDRHVLAGPDLQRSFTEDLGKGRFHGTGACDSRDAPWLPNRQPLVKIQ